MHIYHGTSATIAQLSQSDGLAPRIQTGVDSNWKEHPSHSELVYLTTVYAGYFAANASDDDHWGIVEIDTELLDCDAMRPDEDFLEQASSKEETQAIAEEMSDEVLPTLDMQGRIEWFKDNIDFFDHLWEESVRRLGTCSHVGLIPPAAITRISIFDPKSNQRLSWASLDPQISLLNYKILNQKYMNITRELMGDPVQETEMEKACRENIMKHKQEN